MKKLLLLLILSYFLTGCYTSFSLIEDYPQRTIIVTPTPTTYYYSPMMYNRIWIYNKYVYIPYYRTVDIQKRTTIQQPRRTHLESRNLDRNREIRTNHNVQSSTERSTTIRTTPRQTSTVNRGTTTNRTRSSSTTNRKRNNE